MQPKIPDPWFAFVKQNGRALRDVPEGERSLELCTWAILHCPAALRYVPECHRSELLYVLAVQQQDALLYVPESQRTRKVCFTAVRRDGMALSYVPLQHRTPDLCLAAVQQDGSALRFVPSAFRTAELCWWAANAHHGLKALLFVPEEERSIVLLLTALSAGLSTRPDECAVEEYVRHELTSLELLRLKETWADILRQFEYERHGVRLCST